MYFSLYMGPISIQCMLFPITMCMVPENWSLKLLVCFCSGEEAKLRRKLYSVDYWDCRDSAPNWVCPVISSVQNIIEFPLVVDLFLLGAFSLFLVDLYMFLHTPSLSLVGTIGLVGEKTSIVAFFFEKLLPCWEERVVLFFWQMTRLLCLPLHGVYFEVCNDCRYKLRNIEETEAAKKLLQENRLTGRIKTDSSIPSSYSADYFQRGRDYAEKLRRGCFTLASYSPFHFVSWTTALVFPCLAFSSNLGL